MMARLFVCGGLGIWMMGTLAVAGRTFRPSPHGRPEPEPARCSNGKVRLLRETDLVCPQCSISLPCIDEDGDSMVPYAVGIVFVLLVLLSLGIFIYCLRKRRSDEENSFQQPTQLSTLPTSQYEDVTPLDDDDRNGASRDYHVTRGDHSPVGVQTGSGSDDDQYGRLDRNGRKPNGAVGHSDVYGHATSPQPATSEGAEESASQQENDVYNQLRRYRKKQIVMDNVYDSTR